MNIYILLIILSVVAGTVAVVAITLKRYHMLVVDVLRINKIKDVAELGNMFAAEAEGEEEEEEGDNLVDISQMEL